METVDWRGQSERIRALEAGTTTWLRVAVVQQVILVGLLASAYLSWKVVAPLAGWAVRCGLELERQYIYGVQKGSAYTSYRLVYTSYRLVYTSYRLVFTCTLLEATAPAVER